MRPAGFLLAGGKSRRMGTDKGLLELGGRSLLERTAGELAAVCETVTIVGGVHDTKPIRVGHRRQQAEPRPRGSGCSSSNEPFDGAVADEPQTTAPLRSRLSSERPGARSRQEQVTVNGVEWISDDIEGIGPAGGILTALRRADGWCLVMAVDMPAVGRELLAEILQVAETTFADCVVPVGKDGRIHPLCAAYHSRCLPVWESAVSEGIRRVREIIVRISAVTLHPGNEEMLRNVNTPAEWQEFLNHAAR